MTRPERLISISHGNIPSKWAHTFQVMKMAEALGCVARSVTLLTAGSFLRGSVYDVDLWNWYGVDRTFRVVRLPAHLRIRDRYFTRYIDRRFDLAAALYARLSAPDIVFTRSHGAAALCVRLGLPTIFETHAPASDPSLLPVLKVAQRRHFLGFVTVTKALAQDYAALGFPPDKIMVWPDAVDLKRFTDLPDRLAARRRLGWPLNDIIAVYAGHFYPQKGVPTLVDAARLAPDIAFHLVGGWPKDIEEMRERSRGCGNVHFTGFVPNREVPQHLAAADVLVLPNSAKSADARCTSPLKLFEYMAAGRPIVATRIPAFEGLIRHGENGYCVAADTPAALAEAVRKVATDASLSQRLARTAQCEALQFTWVRRAEQILARFQPDRG